MADGMEYINIADGTKRVMNNTKLYAKLLNKFKEDPSFGQLTEALEKGDLVSAQGFAHTLKGLAANLSLTELYKQSMELEAQIKAGAADSQQLELLKNIYAGTIIEVDKVITQYA